MNDKKELEQLDKVFAAGDAWLRKFGIVDPSVNPVAHNNIVMALYMNFPKVKHVEYFMSKRLEERWIKIVLHVPFWKLLFTRRERMVDDVIDLVREYLNDYRIDVELRRYKRKDVVNAP